MLHKSIEDHLEKWIWIANPDPIPNSYIQARKTFALDKAPTSALIKASADSRYKLFVNGHYVGKGPVRSAEGCCYVDTHDVTHMLTRGNNVIAVLAHHIGENTYACSAGKPGLICRAEIEIDGKVHAFGTDESWKVRRADEWTTSGARMSHRLGFQEVYDAGEACEDWNQVKCGDKGWEHAVVVGAPPAMPWGELKPRQIPLLLENVILPQAIVGTYNGAEVGKETPAASMPAIMATTELANMRSGDVKQPEALLAEDGQTEVRTPRGDKGVVILLDFGREVFGNVDICLAGASGCIDIGYGEALLEGRVKPNRDDTRYTDRIYIRRGKLEWQSFEPRAFRYMQIEFRRCTRPVTVDYIRVNQTTYPATQTGVFECSDKLVNQIWEAGVYTAQLCMEDTFIDCPWRERGQWWGDARIISRTAYYAFDDTTMLAQGLRQFASAQRDNGAIPGLYPPGDMAIAPDFALLWAFSILDYYAFSDDADLVRELYPSVRKMLSWFAGFAGDSGILAGVPGRLLIDRADLERRGEVTSLNCFYHQALRIAAALASIAGENEEAQGYIDTANRLKVALNKYMYVPKRGLYAECRIDGKLVEKFSRQTNILAALFDITDQYQKAGIFRQLSNGALPALGTPYFASYFLEALYSADRHADALDYIRRKWGKMIESGATTLWEDFDADTQGALCHGSAVCPTRDLIAEFVGIKPVPGVHRFAVAPHPADLKWARAAVQTKTGRLAVDWRVLRNRLDIEVEVPQGLKVDVYPPGPIDCTITVDGKHWPSRFVTLSEGKHIVRVTQPKPEKISTYDEAPAGLTPHVEVLDRGIRIGRRGIAIEPRRRGRRSARAEEPLEVRMDAAEIAERPETRPAAEAQDEELARKRKRRPRGGRGRRKTATTEPQAVEPVAQEAVAAEPAPETEAVLSEAAEPAGEAPATKRRRRPRGGRGRRKTTTTTEQQAAEPIAEEASTPEPVAEPEAAPTELPESTEEAPKRRRRPRGGRGRRRSTTPGEPEATGTADEQVAVPEPAPEPIAVESSETEATSEQPAAPKRRRGSRGGRGRKRPAGSEPVQSELPVDVPPTPEPPQEPAQTDQPVEQPKRRRRTYTRRRRPTAGEETTPPEPTE